MKVYPGDQITAEVWTYYEATSGYSTNGVALVSAIAAVFGGSSGGSGESLKIFDGINSALGGFAAGGSPDDEEPPAYLNYILFDQQYKVLDAGWERIPTSANFAKQKVTLATKSITEAGYYFTYLSYEGESNNYVYFDDFKVTHTRSNLIQGNEYYPFGLQTENSWTRESVTGNMYLANGSTEMNATTQVYDLDFRNYDPALGRMYGVDPLAVKYASLTPYNYSFNNPIGFSDPSGAEPEDITSPNPNYQYYYHNGAGASGAYGLSYDDYDPMTRLASGEFRCALCGRKDNIMGFISGSESMGDWRDGLPMSIGMFLSQAMHSSDGGSWSGGNVTFYSSTSEAISAGYNYASRNSPIAQSGENRNGGNHGGRGLSKFFKGIGSFFKSIFGNRSTTESRLITFSTLDETKEHMLSLTEKTGKMAVGFGLKKGGYVVLPNDGNDVRGTSFGISEIESRIKKKSLQVKVDGSWYGVTDLLLSIPSLNKFEGVHKGIHGEAIRMNHYESIFEPRWKNDAKEWNMRDMYIFSTRPEHNWGLTNPGDTRRVKIN